MTRDTATKQSRRSVLSLGAKAAAVAGVASLAAPLSRAAAAGNSAVVCLYLIGGNDSNNLIVPLDSPAYDLYARGRGALAIPQSDLLDVYATNGASRYGFHPSLPGLRDLYNQGVLAVLANVGRIDTPLTQAQIRSNSNALPENLFLHTGAAEIGYAPNGYLTLPWADGGGSLFRLNHGVTLTSANGRPATGSPFETTFPSTRTGRQLANVAGILLRGVHHQAFVCPVDGFDTHADQLSQQAALFTELNDAIVAFYGALQDLGIADRVTLFTQTEFNRALAPNARGGTDHGWGGHELIVGRSVIGGQVYGRFPSLELGGADDAGNSGIWIPSTALSQYTGTLARWYGADVRGNFAGQTLAFL
jgi:uncharacterized protein (DUF1501 family)